MPIFSGFLLPLHHFKAYAEVAKIGLRCRGAYGNRLALQPAVLVSRTTIRLSFQGVGLSSELTNPFLRLNGQYFTFSINYKEVGVL